MPYVLRRVDKDDYVALVIELGLKQQWRVKNNGSDAWLGHLNSLLAHGTNSWVDNAFEPLEFLGI